MRPGRLALVDGAAQSILVKTAGKSGDAAVSSADLCAYM